MSLIIYAGAYQTIVAAPASFVTKFKPGGGAIAWSTYFGVATGTLEVADVAVSSTGAVWITGRTSSALMPTTPHAFDRSYNLNTDGFVACLSGDGSNLLASSYLGGSNYDQPNGIAVDSMGRPIIVGSTTSGDLPTKPDAFDTVKGAGFDGFVSRLSADCRTLIAGTFLGAPVTGEESVYDAAVDSAGRIVVVGYSSSPDFPTTAGAYKTGGSAPHPTHSEVAVQGNPTLLGGMSPSDAFIVRLSSGLKTLVSSTLLGGSAGDAALRLALDSSSNAVIEGLTTSSDFPTTEGAFNRTHLGPFVAKINPTATKLLQSTFWVATSSLSGLAVNQRDEIVLTGRAYNASFPITLDAFDTTYEGEFEGTVSILDKLGTRVLYSSYVGGNARDFTTNPALSADGTIVFAGSTESSDFQTTTGAYSRTYKGLSDAFVMRVTTRQPASLSLSKSSVVGGFGLEGTVTLDKSAPPNGAKVVISSTPALLSTQVVKVAPGALSKTFAIATPGVATKTVIQVKASAGGKTVSQSLTLNVGGLIGISLNPSTVVSGNESIATVTLSGKAPAGGRIVKLSTTAPALMPQSVTVPAGATSATFSILSLGGGISGYGIITAKLGTAQVEAALTIIPFDFGSQ